MTWLSIPFPRLASVCLKYLGKESIEGEMKTLPRTAPPHEPCAPAEQSHALFSIITLRLPHFMPLLPLFSLLRKPFYHLASTSPHLPRTSYNADSSTYIFPPARHEVVSLFQPLRVLYCYLFYYTFHCPPYRFIKQLYERIGRREGEEKEKEKEANSGNYVWQCGNNICKYRASF